MIRTTLACDRCPCELELPPGPPSIPSGCGWEKNIAPGGVQLDLCPDCSNALKAFLAPQAGPQGGA